MKRFKHWEFVAIIVIFFAVCFVGYQFEYKPAQENLQRTKAHYLEIHKTFHHIGCTVKTAEAADDCMIQIMKRDLRDLRVSRKHLQKREIHI